jgi:hypothetical protein
MEEQLTYRWETLPNIGYVTADFSDQQLKPITDEIEEIQNNFVGAKPANYKLAGLLKKEFELNNCLPQIENLVIPLIHALDSHFKLSPGHNTNRNYKLTDSWVNFQSKYEQNPLHNHTGLYSFVIWTKIPYDYDKELKEFPDLRGEAVDSVSSFTFAYTDILGRICQQTVHPVENRIVVFPSVLSHFVTPFYTAEGYRISVSGNINAEKNVDLQ